MFPSSLELAGGRKTHDFMKSRYLVLLLSVVVYVAGCATDSELTQKEKDRMAREQQREQQREAQKQAQQQEKMLRGGTNQNRMGTGMRGR